MCPIAAAGNADRPIEIRSDFVEQAEVLCLVPQAARCKDDRVLLLSITLRKITGVVDGVDARKRQTVLF